MPRAEPATRTAATRTRTPRKASPAKPGAAAPQGRGDAVMARAHTGDALATLVAIMTNAEAPATARVSAANAVLDRAWGKPRQDFEFSSAGDPIAAIQRARQRVHRQRSTHNGEADAGTIQEASDETRTQDDGGQ